MAEVSQAVDWINYDIAVGDVTTYSVEHNKPGNPTFFVTIRRAAADKYMVQVDRTEPHFYYRGGRPPGTTQTAKEVVRSAHEVRQFLRSQVFDDGGFSAYKRSPQEAAQRSAEALEVSLPSTVRAPQPS